MVWKKRGDLWRWLALDLCLLRLRYLCHQFLYSRLPRPHTATGFISKLESQGVVRPERKLTNIPSDARVDPSIPRALWPDRSVPRPESMAQDPQT